MPPKTPKKLLWESLEGLSKEDFKKFCHALIDRPQDPRVRRNRVEGKNFLDVSDVMVSTFTGTGALKVAEEILRDIGCSDDAEELAAAAAGFHSPAPGSTDEQKHKSLWWKETTMKKLLRVFEDLSFSEFRRFVMILKWNLRIRSMYHPPELQMITDREELAEQMVLMFDDRTLEETRSILKDLNRDDLVEKLSEQSSAGPSRGLDPQSCRSVVQDSHGWTKLQPKVNSTDISKAPTYSLQSEAGHFECCVSGLRWVCKDTVEFEYWFNSWAGHMERMKSMGYGPAGPLMDITIISGTLTEVHLPHWVCIDDNPKILDQFAVLHIDDSGDVVEKASEVTSSHLNLTEPVFSPRSVLVKLGFPVKIRCNMLIYQTNTAFLTLHVYLIPDDPGLRQEIDQNKQSKGCKVIEKSDPVNPLKAGDCFLLSSNLEDAKISLSQGMKLGYPVGRPNFFEVYIENPDKNFQLRLKPNKEPEPVWDCVIRKGEYQGSKPAQAGCSSAAAALVETEEEHFVDKHRDELIQRVCSVGTILDKLLKEGVMTQEVYDEIRSKPTSQQSIRAIYDGPMRAGRSCKDIFYSVLQINEKSLIKDLNSKK